MESKSARVVRHLVGVAAVSLLVAAAAPGSASAGKKSCRGSCTGAADTTAPTTPTGLSKTSQTVDSIGLGWNPSSDAVGVAGYGAYLDGVRVGTTSATSRTFAALSCGKSYTLAVDAYDAAGNRSAKASLGAATLACTPASQRYAIRGIYDRDIDGQAAIGFNFIDSGAYRDQMDVLAARGLKGFVWLGGYSNTTCTFSYSDDWVRSHVAAIAGHPGVGAYFIDDEPNAALCPSAPAQIRARSGLVKSIDPGPPTFIVTYKVEQLALFAGTVDVLGLDRYPCSIKYGCDYSKIDAVVAEAERLGVRYWAVIQAFGDAWYRMPTPEELHQQFVRWRATNMEGYLVFAWRFPAADPSLWLANNLPVQVQFAVENAG
jgi:hypothetical protein